MRKSGIDLIGDVPWGTHFCQFYETKEDLIDILVPYFKAGLENNEFCMWITSEPLEVDEARAALSDVLPDLDNYLEKGQIEIIPYNEWYTIDGVFDSDRVLNGWVEKLNKALEKGFEGLRLTGNTFWLEKEDWDDFVEYEEQVDKVIGSYQMMAMCTYSLDKCNANEIIDVVNNHEFALIKRSGEWTLVESSKRKEIEDSLIESEEKFSKAFHSNSAAMTVTRVRDGLIVDANESFERLFGYTHEEIVGHTTNELGIWLSPEERDSEVEQLLKQGRLPMHEVTFGSKSGELIKSLFSVELISIRGDDFILSTVMDITKRKNAEDALLKAIKQSEYDRKRLETILETTPAGVIIVEASDGGVSYINKRAKQLYGIDITGLNLKTAITKVKSRKADGSEYPIGEGPTGLALKGQTVHNEEMIIEQENGTGIPIFGSAAPILNSDGEITAAVAIFEDITERKKGEEALKESEYKYRNIIDNLQDAYMKGNNEGLIEMVSPSAAKMYGFDSPESMIGIPNATLYKDPEDRKTLLMELKKYGKLIDYECEGLKTDGTSFPVSMNVQLHYDVHGQIMGTETLVRDITERKQLEEEQDKLTKQRQLALDAAKMGWWHYNPITNISYYDEQYKKIFGVTGSQRPNDEILKRLHPEDLPNVWAEVEKALNPSDPKPYFSEYRIFLDDGSMKWIEAYGIATFDGKDENRHGTSLVGTVADITERKKVEEAIKRQADLIEQSFDAILVIKLDGSIENWNLGAQQLYGYSKSEAIGNRIYELLHTNFPIPWTKIEKELQTGGMWEGELKHITKTGQEVIVLSRMQLLMRDDSNSMLLETNRDITQRKRAEEHLQELLEKEQQLTEELSATNEELQATSEELRTSNEELMVAQSSLSELIIKLKISNKELEQFAYVASHDLQEPLRMVSSFTQLLERRYRGRLDEDADDYIEFIVEGAQRMKYLIDDLLTFSRLNTKVKEFEQILMEVTLDDVLLNLKALIKENDAQITHDVLPEVIGDPSQINQLLQNLIANAIKFHGEEPPQIHIKSQELENEWLISISDNGVGIDPNHQELIFRIFKRLHTREEYAGTGIGLAICKKIVERHGGRIWVESEPEKGSTFYFTIPK